MRRLRRLIDKPRGVLRSAPVDGEILHDRHAPPDELAGVLEHIWTVRWRLAAPTICEVLSHPSIHVVFEPGRTEIVGVPRGRFTRRLEGDSFVVGLKFRPGCFRPFTQFPIARLADRMIPLGEVFAGPADAAAAVLAAPTMAARIEGAAQFLADRLLPRDPVADHAAAIVKRILDDREIRTVDDVARRFATSPRALQRLFHEYVGVTPKWVIRRYRLHEAIERMDAGGAVDWSALAHELGYFDQAHFSNDFKKLVGRSPGRYFFGAASPSGSAGSAAAAAAGSLPAGNARYA